MDPAAELLTDSSELSSADYPVLKLIKPSFSTGIGNTIDRIYRMNKWIQHNLNDTLKLGPDILKPEILNPVTGKWSFNRWKSKVIIAIHDSNKTKF